MRVLVVNAGSSSVKLSLLDGGRTEEERSVDPDGVEEALAALLSDVDAPDAVGHRVVHGGTRFTGPAVVDDDVVDAIADLVPLAPLHQAPALAALHAARGALPAAVQVACFDTAFHTTMPAAAHTYAVPRAWRRELGVRRYGFHGLAHAWAASRAAQITGRPVDGLRVVSAHLGSGASVCAVDGGRSVDTTMGFTPTSGLVMSTRCGDLDPAVPLWLLDRGLGAEEISDGLELGGGLAALAGDADVRTVLAAADRHDPDAELALDVWAHRARAALAGMAAAMGGTDVVVFGGGVGEHQPRLRARVADGLAFLGLTLDADRNAAAREGDADIGAGDGRVLVVHTREDWVIARQVAGLLAD